MPRNFLRGKKVLLMGLGILGGGLNTARWLIKKGAKLTVTDLKTKEQLTPSLRKLRKIGQKIELVLGRHEESDILGNDVIVINPDVPLTSPYLRLAIKNKKQIENELTLFCHFANTENLIAVTGTRGKTTTANWITHFIRQKYPKAGIAGNSTQNPLLKVVGTYPKNAPIVVESPSFLLEHIPDDLFTPRVSVITNIYPDHLNRYTDITHYARVKGNIFKNQTRSNSLILNFDNKWSKFYLSLKPNAEVLFFSTKKLPRGKNGAFVGSGYKLFAQKAGRTNFIYNAKNFVTKWGRHNLENLMAAMLAATEFGVPQEAILRAINTLPQIKFRQELIYANKRIKIYNDTSATSPEATMAALERFSGRDNLILLAGGTDRNLEFKPWAKSVKKFLRRKNLVLLNGSATLKMEKELKWKEIGTFDTLEECLIQAIKLARMAKGKSVILFSPGAKSFEKFKNEYDRGLKFNKLVKKYVNHN